MTPILKPENGQLELQDNLSQGSMVVKSLLESNNHIGVFGITGSGKTTLAKALYIGVPGNAIFINTNEEDIPGIQTSAWKANLITEPRVVINPPPAVTNLKTITDLIIKTAFEQARDAKALNRTRAKTFWLTLFIDEAQGFKSEEIERAFKTGLRWGIRVIAITQNPVRISLDYRTQMKLHINFRLSTLNKPYYREHGLPFDKIKAATDQQYAFIVFDGVDISPAYVLKLSHV